MDEEVHEGTYVAVVQTVLKYRRLRLIQLVCTWHIWTCDDASQLCLLEHLEHVTHPTPVDVSLPMYSFLALILQLCHSSMSYLLLLQLCLAPQAAGSSFLVPGLILPTPHSV